ncbi:MAG TPA: rRNA (cytidine-2'-O-)-methyltransferase, partial [Thermomonas sp.]|nr:rRNA (cytidine-2'-O-)-methyltransferase [Thermomonas sp.]
MHVSGTLFVVATPIGNLGDMTPRAQDTLRSVAAICAEDTRRSGQLLAHFGIQT